MAPEMGKRCPIVNEGQKVRRAPRNGQRQVEVAHGFRMAEELCLRTQLEEPSRMSFGCFRVSLQLEIERPFFYQQLKEPSDRKRLVSGFVQRLTGPTPIFD